MSFRHAFPMIGLLIAVPSQAQEVAPPFGDPAYISPNARLEMVFNEGLALTESPAEGPDGMIYFSDITFTSAAGPDGIEAGHIWRYDPKTGESTIFRSPSGMSNGLKFDAQDRLIAAEGADYGGRRVTRTDMKTGKSYIIAGTYEGRPFNAPNDLTIDEKGRVYFSDPKYIGYESVEQPVMAVYRIDTDGSIHRIITDAGKPNGVVVSPDQKTLYVVSNDNGSIDLGKITPDIPCRRAGWHCWPTTCTRTAPPRSRASSWTTCLKTDPTDWSWTSRGTCTCPSAARNVRVSPYEPPTVRKRPSYRPASCPRTLDSDGARTTGSCTSPPEPDCTGSP